MKQKITSVKGTRDFYPPEMRIRTNLYQTMRSISESFGYEEYDGPFLEYIELYAAKSGEELVKEQAFVFQDRGGDWITLRPELTPSLARMVAQKQPQLNFPLRWWSFGPMWRYERPQKGRSREFFQWNIDLIGAESAEADAEIVAIGASFLNAVGLTPQQVNILVNNRRLVDNELEQMQIPTEQRSIVFRLIDRRDKMPLEIWQAYGLELGLSEKQINLIQKMLEDHTLWEKSAELKRFFNAIEAFGVKEYVRYSPEVIRGLDYYTGTVFEARDRDGDFRAILGGGRYDNLVADVGGNPLSGVGFAMGDVVINLVLHKFNHQTDTEKSANAPILVTVYDQDCFLHSIEIAAGLRQAGFKAIHYPQPIGLGKQFKYADRLGSPLVIVVGPDELHNGTITIKQLTSGQQHSVEKGKLIDTVKTFFS